jgi:hypothetical protein
MASIMAGFMRGGSCSWGAGLAQAKAKERARAGSNSLECLFPCLNTAAIFVRPAAVRDGRGADDQARNQHNDSNAFFMELPKL